MTHLKLAAVVLLLISFGEEPWLVQHRSFIPILKNYNCIHSSSICQFLHSNVIAGMVILHSGSFGGWVQHTSLVHGISQQL